MSDFVRHQLTVFDAELARLEREAEGIRRARAALADVLGEAVAPEHPTPVTAAPSPPSVVTPVQEPEPVRVPTYPDTSSADTPTQAQTVVLAPDPSKATETLLEWVDKRGKQPFNSAMVMELLGLKKTRAYEVLGAAYNEGYLEPLGNGWYRKRDQRQAPTAEEEQARVHIATGSNEQILTAEEVRDVVLKSMPRNDPWRMGDLKTYFPHVSQETVRRRLDELVKLGIVRTIGQRAGMRYQYNPPPASGPTVRPRGEQKVPGQDSERRATGVPVPNTGPPMGRTGHPGKDQRLARAGKNIVRH